ncbi:hypothetical protein TWF788_008959 [Orbilia oligospora]|uniref:Intradiol ring-cleavage dioxygenases domain-containing protein n=1 Tax=Orbilia oligospora TaxID=2813651 RepID=A0A7C8PFA7_ORBOL|nr:hypothetical protein TWF788_008959 [Orbilia oligospora]
MTSSLGLKMLFVFGLFFIQMATAALAPPQAWRKKNVVYKTIISLSTVTETMTLAGEYMAEQQLSTCPVSEPSRVNNDIDPPITYSACGHCPVATVSYSDQRITSIGDVRDNGTHTYVPYYFAGFHEWVFAYTKTVTLYMSLSAVNGQPATATGTESQVGTSFTYSLSITNSIVSISPSSTVYESTSRISRTGPCFESRSAD